MLRGFWDYLTDKRQLSMRDRATDELHWRVNLTPMGLSAMVVGLVVLLFVTLLALMAYTSILDILPGYRTKAERTNEALVESIMRIDLMERNMAELLAYNEAVATVMGGSTPALHSTVMTDTIRYDKSRILPTRADSLLRAALESTTGEYSLTNTKPLQSEAAMFSAPLRGTITRNFDAPESSYDVAIMSLKEQDSVTSIENGTVVATESMADGSKSVTIQHAGGYISVYKHLSEVLVRKGQMVQSGAVIGRLGTHEGEDSRSTELGFELWRDGTAVDPERYILF
ncbi:MAG: M23 family metallopeptidase [Alistipes sp.]|nr:M23 family metallopeptidase [Alistipes sp.]MBQ3248832.1 M23 family metallopeptidase [Alistipes sp.]